MANVKEVSKPAIPLLGCLNVYTTIQECLTAINKIKTLKLGAAILLGTAGYKNGCGRCDKFYEELPSVIQLFANKHVYLIYWKHSTLPDNKTLKSVVTSLFGSDALDLFKSTVGEKKGGWHYNFGFVYGWATGYTTNPNVYTRLFHYNACSKASDVLKKLNSSGYKYIAPALKISITYLLDGKQYTTLSYDAGTKLSFPTAPTKLGYSFSKWVDSKTGLTVLSNGLTLPSTTTSYSLTAVMVNTTNGTATTGTALDTLISESSLTLAIPAILLDKITIDFFADKTLGTSIYTITCNASDVTVDNGLTRPENSELITRVNAEIAANGQRWKLADNGNYLAYECTTLLTIEILSNGRFTINKLRFGSENNECVHILKIVPTTIELPSNATRMSFKFYNGSSIVDDNQYYDIIVKNNKKYIRFAGLNVVAININNFSNWTIAEKYAKVFNRTTSFVIEDNKDYEINVTEWNKLSAESYVISVNALLNYIETEKFYFGYTYVEDNSSNSLYKNLNNFILESNAINDQRVNLKYIDQGIDDYYCGWSYACLYAYVNTANNASLNDLYAILNNEKFRDFARTTKILVYVKTDTTRSKADVVKSEYYKWLTNYDKSSYSVENNTNGRIDVPLLSLRVHSYCKPEALTEAWAYLKESVDAVIEKLYNQLDDWQYLTDIPELDPEDDTFKYYGSVIADVIDESIIPAATTDLLSLILKELNITDPYELVEGQEYFENIKKYAADNDYSILFMYGSNVCPECDDLKMIINEDKFKAFCKLYRIMLYYYSNPYRKTYITTDGHKPAYEMPIHQWIINAGKFISVNSIATEEEILVEKLTAMPVCTLWKKEYSDSDRTAWWGNYLSIKATSSELELKIYSSNFDKRAEYLISTILKVMRKLGDTLADFYDDYVDVASNEPVTKWSYKRNFQKLINNDINNSRYVESSNGYVDLTKISTFSSKNTSGYRKGQYVFFKPSDESSHLYILESRVDNNTALPTVKSLSLNSIIIDALDLINTPYKDVILADEELNSILLCESDNNWIIHPHNLIDDSGEFLNSFDKYSQNDLFDIHAYKTLALLSALHCLLQDKHPLGKISYNDSSRLHANLDNISDDRTELLHPYEITLMKPVGPIIEGSNYRKWLNGVLEYDIMYKLGVSDTIDLTKSNIVVDINANSLILSDIFYNSNYFDKFSWHDKYMTFYTKNDENISMSYIKDEKTYLISNIKLNGNNILHSNIYFDLPFVNTNYMIFNDNSCNCGLIFTNKTYNSITPMIMIPDNTSLTDIIGKNFSMHVVGRWK